MSSYYTKDGDTLDTICHRHYGASSGYVEAVLEANRNLAAQGAILPSGMMILLPDLPELKPYKATLRLWD
jgi:phage tail protein X